MVQRIFNRAKAYPGRLLQVGLKIIPTISGYLLSTRVGFSVNLANFKKSIRQAVIESTSIVGTKRKSSI